MNNFVFYSAMSFIKSVKYTVLYLCLILKYFFANVVIHLKSGWFGSWLKTL